MSSTVRSVITEAMKKSYPCTKVISIDPTAIDDTILLEHVVPVLQSGDIVAFPTETVYGLGGNALDSSAINKIFEGKGRPSDNPLIVHIFSLDQLRDLVAPGAFPEDGTLTRKLCDKFWPGPLTILFPKSDKIANNVTAGQESVGIRMPSHPVARRILELSGLPLAAPSANRSGRPSPTCASHVLLDLGRVEEPNSKIVFEFGKGAGVGCIVDGGECNVGVESTVVRVEDYKVLRPGTVTLEQLKEIDSRFELYSAVHKQFSKTEVLSKEEEESISAPATPGLKYTHYAPSVPVILFEFIQPWTNFQKKIISYIEKKIQQNPDVKIGVLRVHHDHVQYPDVANLIVCDIGTTGEPGDVARNLFAAFRYFDSQNVNSIIMEGISEEKEGMAVMNRARKAAASIL